MAPSFREVIDQDLRRRVRRRPPGSPRGWFLAATVWVVVVASGCSGATDETVTSRPRPTDTGLHDHSGENSALAPETVSAQDIAGLGEGVPADGRFEGHLGINVCGRFLELPERDPHGGVSVDTAGQLVIAPGPGDESGLEVTVGDVLAVMDVTVDTGSLGFGPAWAATEATLDGDEVSLGGTTLSTGDSCGREQGEVQLWYYTEEATDSGEDIRMVVTDPQDVPIAGDHTAVTVAFAPTSSLPTLPPAVLVGPG